MTTQQKPVVLVILDGWGIAPAGPGNAITLAQPKTFTRLWEEYPHTQLQASGKAVGLPEGADGNSEVGHLNLGAGRIVLQDVARINQAIGNGSFFSNEALLSAVAHAKTHQSNLHVLGLIGGGVVHASNAHLFALLKLAQQQHCTQVYLHLFTDGRDSSPKSALTYLEQAKRVMAEIGIGTIASVMGRYYAMDRDQRWERTQRAYEALTDGKGKVAPTAEAAITTAYQRGETDEFIQPTLIATPDGQPPLITKGDALIFLNFRLDRVRQLTKAFVLPDFETQAHQTGFDLKMNPLLAEQIARKERHPVFTRNRVVSDLCVVTMTSYEPSLTRFVAVAFPERELEQPLGQVVAEAGLSQLRAAETEKERFVTYYFNGFRPRPFAGEDHLIVPSPPVATYDKQPEMSAYLLTERFLDRLEKQAYAFALINFANPDMVGHTGDVTAAVKAIQAVDECLEGIVDFVLSQNGTVLITADHGNSEEMIERESGSVDTKHSVSPVPLIAVNSAWRDQQIFLPQGILADVAPSILQLLPLKKPAPMTGKSLVTQLVQPEGGA